MSTPVEVRPFESPSEYERMVDYFLDGGEDFQRGMGIDPAKVLPREHWLAAVLADHERPDGQRERLYLAWRVEGELVGHSSISHLQPGRQGHVHLHLWRPELRGRGLGTELMTRSIDLYFERLRLERLFCEPFAENPAPNRTMDRLGFRLVKTYRTVPNPITFEQVVNRYEMTRERWLSYRR